MLIIGGDIGHTNTKTCIGLKQTDLDIFRSSVGEVNEDILNKRKDIIITYKKQDYAIGTNYGDYSVEDDKSKDEIFKLCLFTAVSRVMKNNRIENVSLVTGLPINYYKKYRNALIESLEGETIRIQYLKQEKIMNFANVKPYPESAGIVILEKDKFRGPRIIIDIGGSTVDVSYFEGTSLIKATSYDLGMQKVYSKIAKYINEQYGTDYNVQAAERIVKSKNIVANDNEIEFDSTRYLNAHASEVLRRVKLDFPWKTSLKTFIGGGSVELKDFLPNGHKITYDNVFTNAKAFYWIGVGKYGKC